MPEAWGCPVTCQTGQKVCYNTDYNASGYPEKYTETCVAEAISIDSRVCVRVFFFFFTFYFSQGTPCTCGTNSQSCLDPFYGESFCYPLADFWCPLRLNLVERS